MRLPAEVRQLIWGYVRSERLHYYHDEEEYGQDVIQYTEEEDPEPPFPTLWSSRGVLLACRLAYSDAAQAPQPTTMHAQSRYLNDVLDLLRMQRHIIIDELQLTYEGESIRGEEEDSTEIDVDEVHDYIATTLLELKRRHVDASFTGIHWLFTGTNDDGMGPPKEFRMVYNVRVGPLRPKTLRGRIKDPQDHSEEALGAERDLLEASLSMETLELLLNEMEDTPSCGASRDELEQTLKAYQNL